MKVLLLAFLVSFPAWGTEALPDLALRMKDALFVSLDANRDGFISRKEAAGHAAVAKNFHAADDDGDGRLDPGEFSRIAVNRSDQPGPYRTSIRG